MKARDPPKDELQGRGQNTTPHHQRPWAQTSKSRSHETF